MSSSGGSLEEKVAALERELGEAEAKLKLAEDAGKENLIGVYGGMVTMYGNNLISLRKQASVQQQTIGHLHNVLTTQWKGFLALASKSEQTSSIHSECGLPFPPLINEIITTIYVRDCYTKWFERFSRQAKEGETTFAVSGTPGIGKSWLAIHLLYSIPRSKDLAGKDILYHYEDQFYHFACNGDVRRVSKETATDLADGKPAIYIIDGNHSLALQVAIPCISIYISSPRNSYFDEWCKQKRIGPLYFPVWTLDELLACQPQCYASLDVAVIERRFTQYGGIPRSVFASKVQPPSIEALISDADTRKSIAQVNSPSLKFPSSHMLLHIIVGDDFQFLYLDLASDYIGVKLFEKNFKETIESMRSLIGVGGALGGHLFESYLHFTFKYSDELKFPCRSLEGSPLESEISFSKSEETKYFRELPSELDPIIYYQPMLSNFPALDALVTEGLLQFTINIRHPINGEMLSKVIGLYSEKPINYYFFVPSHIFPKFNKQRVTDKNDSARSASRSCPEIRQFAVSVNVNIDSFPGDIESKQKRRRTGFD